PASPGGAASGPPLMPSGPSIGFALNGTLLALLPERAKPVPLPTALKLALVVVLAVARKISGPLTLVLPETTELARVNVPATRLGRASPPPPVPAAAPLARLLVTVLFWRLTGLLPGAPAPPPPDVPAVLPLRVLLRKVIEPVPTVSSTP